MVEVGAAGPILQDALSMEAPVWHVLLTMPVVTDGEFLAPGAIADAVEVGPHGGGEQPLQIVRVWQENSSARWFQICALKTQGPPPWSPQCPLTSILSHLWRGERDERIHIVFIHHRQQCPAYQAPCRQNTTLGRDLGTAGPTLPPSAPPTHTVYLKETEAQRRHTPCVKTSTSCK